MAGGRRPARRCGAPESRRRVAAEDVGSAPTKKEHERKNVIGESSEKPAVMVARLDRIEGTLERLLEVMSDIRDVLVILAGTPGPNAPKTAEPQPYPEPPPSWEDEWANTAAEPERAYCPTCGKPLFEPACGPAHRAAQRARAAATARKIGL